MFKERHENIASNIQFTFELESSADLKDTRSILIDNKSPIS